MYYLIKYQYSKLQLYIVNVEKHQEKTDGYTGVLCDMIVSDRDRWENELGVKVGMDNFSFTGEYIIDTNVNIKPLQERMYLEAL